jgi:hypothetical protein
MKSIDFLAANIAIAKDQPEYNTLYGHVIHDDPTIPIMVCMDLTDEDIEDIKTHRKLWVQQLTFGNRYTPMAVLTKSPYLHEQSGTPMDENRMASEAWDKLHFKSDQEHPDRETICNNCGRIWDVHVFSTRQCEIP